MGYGKMCSAEDAPAFAGSAMNENYPAEQRLAMGMLALNYYVDQADKLHELAESFDKSAELTSGPTGAYADAARRLRAILDGEAVPEDSFGVVCVACESRNLTGGVCQSCGTIQIRRRPETV